MLRLSGLIFVLAAASAAFSAPYWIDWEGDDWPEAVGYERNWGDSQGQYHGNGANRTLEDGVLTYDSLYSTDVCDVYNVNRFGAMDPASGELFVLEWRLKVDVVNGTHDPCITLFSDGPWGLMFAYAEDHMTNIFEGLVQVPIAPDVWHSYCVTSWDMRNYRLYIDGALAHSGELGHVGGSQSRLSFGDAFITASSLHHWDYVRFGVMPEPCGLLVLLLALAWRGARRA